MSLFQNSVLNKYLKALDHTKVEEAWVKYTAHFHDKEIQRNIRKAKEEQYQSGFFNDLFVKIFGYVMNPQPDFNLTTELKNIGNSKKTDGAILQDGKALAVMELKGAYMVDLDKVEAQAFGYKNNQEGCVYVVIANFQKLRFYIDNSIDYEEFDLFRIDRKRFDVLWLCLAANNLLKNLPKKIKDESLVEEEVITKQLYKDYSTFRNEIFDNIQKNNPDQDKLTLFKKTQKLLDRFLFIFFAEDRGLLPPNSIRQIVSQWTTLRDEFDAYTPLYKRFIQYFNYLNVGHQGRKYEIFAYNGGLFKPDSLLDDLNIDDELLYIHTVKLADYDFLSEVGVNILGHIFEHSLNEIEEIQAELSGTKIERSKTKRKKDGVFYTPKYITKYMVDTTIGNLCNEKKDELKIDILEYGKERKGRQKSTLKKLTDKLDVYRNWLLELTICDPACGSGAFLNQALEFLIEEHKFIDILKNKLLGGSFIFSEVENSILENNLFGVDINEESIEIAKLSLWLRTAQRGRKLTSLNNNIKCGNSLINNSKVAGPKSFDWEKEFPEIGKKGGFDVIIGNPPYGILMVKEMQKYYSDNFPLTKYKTNLYVLFIERMMQIFSKGIVHFIIPKSLLFNSYHDEMRKALITKTELIEIFTITEKVFEDAEVGSSLLLKFKINTNPNLKYKTRLASAEKINDFVNRINLTENLTSQDSFLEVPKCEISIVSSNLESIIKKLRKHKQIKDFYALKNGLNPGNVKHILISNSKESNLHKPIIWGKDIAKYHIKWGGDFINYDEELKEKISLDEIKSKEGMNKQNRIDFALRSKELFENKKIVVRKTGDSLIAAIDENNFYFDTLVHGIYCINPDYKLEPLIAILNSQIATKFYRILHDIKGKVFAKISLIKLSSFPIPELIFQKEGILINNVNNLNNLIVELDQLREHFISLLQSRLALEKISQKIQNWGNLEFAEFIKELKKKKVKLTLNQEAEWMQYFKKQKEKFQLLNEQIILSNREINQLIYEFYGLTKEEINVIEELN